MKKITRELAAVVLAVLMLSQASPALLAGPRADLIKERVAARQEALNQKAVERLHRLGAKLIDHRVNLLNKGIERVNRSAKVSETERNAITGDLTANIDSLTSLKSSIEAETDLETLRAKVKSIFTDYRIFAVVLPRDRGELIVGRANAILGRLNALSAKIAKWIDAGKARGKDMTEAEQAYADFQSKLADARAQVDSAMTHFQAMKASADLTEPRDHLQQGKDAMRQARNDLKAAAEDLRKIVTEFKGLRLGSGR